MANKVLEFLIISGLSIYVVLFIGGTGSFDFDSAIWLGSFIFSFHYGYTRKSNLFVCSVNDNLIQKFTASLGFLFLTLIYTLFTYAIATIIIELF
jgi:hypothetical protein